MKKILIVILLVLISKTNYAQDKTFSYIGEITDTSKIRAIADSLKKPLLLSENKLYAIGSFCIPKLMGGDAIDRDADGNANDRDKNGDKNDRNKGGDSKSRDKKGDANDRNIDGDVNKRNKKGEVDERNKNGSSTNGARCDIDKNGMLILYTRIKLNSKKSQIYYNNKFFSNAYFKIKKS